MPRGAGGGRESPGGLPDVGALPGGGPPAFWRAVGLGPQPESESSGEDAEGASWDARCLPRRGEVGAREGEGYGSFSLKKRRTGGQVTPAARPWVRED